MVHIVTGRVPLIAWEICKDKGALIWREIKKYPIRAVCSMPMWSLREQNHSVTGHVKRFTLMEPNQGTLNPFGQFKRLSLALF